jgi:RNA polymerase sigma-70 factor (ECF subfamily)
VTENDWLAEQFEAERPRLKAVASRMVGPAEADDVVQETWTRLSRSNAGSIEKLGAWLTTVVAHVSLDMLRARSRRDVATARYGELTGHAAVPSPESEAVLADAVGAALIVVLDRLSPSERLAFVLHDLFGVPFEEIAGVLGRSEAATKMLASRARQKVQGSGELDAARPAPHREIVDAFLAASRQGEFEALVEMLHPDVVLRADGEAVRIGSPAFLLGARTVAAVFSGRATAARAVSIDGGIGMVWSVGGRPRVVWDFVIEGGKIVHIDMLATPDSLTLLQLNMLEE